MKSIIVISIILTFSTAYSQVLEYGGTYTFGSHSDGGRFGIIYVHPNSDSTLLFYLELSRGAPSYNSGAMLGQMNIKSPEKGNFTMSKKNDMYNCSLSFYFSNDSLSIHTNGEADVCGLGHAVYPEGDFKKTIKEIPEYFINGEGSKRWFKELNWEKWW